MKLNFQSNSDFDRDMLNERILQRIKRIISSSQELSFPINSNASKVTGFVLIEKIVSAVAYTHKHTLLTCL